MYQLGIYRRDRGQDYIKLMLSGKKTTDIKLSRSMIDGRGYQTINLPHILILF